MPKHSKYSVVVSNMEAGKDLAENLSELYAYCSNRIKYLEDKSNQKLLEVKTQSLAYYKHGIKLIQINIVMLTSYLQKETILKYFLCLVD